MGNIEVLEGLIEEKILDLRTAFPASVISTGEKTATVQPLQQTKEIGRPAQKQPILTDVPVLSTVKKFKSEEITIEGTTFTNIKLEGLKRGDVVFCLCSERELSDTLTGKFTIPQIGHHEVKDAVIVGVF